MSAAPHRPSRTPGEGPSNASTRVRSVRRGDLSVALVGAGRMAATHAQVLASAGLVRIATVCDTRQASAEALAAPLGATATTDLDAVLADEAVDALIITTPTATHADLIVAAAGAGKHVFVEKPVAADLAGADRAAAAVRRSGIRCQVGFQRRFDPAYVEAMRRIEAGELGALEVFRAVSRDPRPPALEFLLGSGGLMVDLGIHDLDSARFFMGEVSEVTCIGAVLAVPELEAHHLYDTAVAVLRFESGALGTVEAGLRTSYGYEIRAEVFGAKGRIHLEMERLLDLRSYDASGARVVPPQSFAERFSVAYEAEILAFARALREDRPVSPDIHDARLSLRLALATQRSLESGATVQVSRFEEEKIP